MDQDLDSRLVQEGVYTNALNIQVSTASDNDVGAVENSLSNRKLTNLDIGSNAKTLGMYFDSVGEKIYYFLTTDSGDYLIEYCIDEESAEFVLIDTSAGVLNFDENFLITGVNLVVDSDNGVRLLLWTDNLNPPRQINIERAKTYGANNFTDLEISLIKPPPLYPPTITLVDSIDEGDQNNIEERFIRFGYRYQYLDNEYSAISPFTNVAFFPEAFFYDFSLSSNESMINAFNQVDIVVNTGPSVVKALEVVFKDSNSSTVYSINSYVKAEQGWSDDIEITVNFINNKIFKALPSDQLFRLYDNVPLKAKAQELIGNRLIFGNYTENYNLVDANGDAIVVGYAVEALTSAIASGLPRESLKSNRDYEIGIAYIDTQGRMTSVLTSDNNTIYFPNPNCILQNQIKVILPNVAPAFATAYRFFIKQTRTDYDTITPSVFYNDGVFVWVLLQGNEVNKVTLGEFIYVKADTQEILDVAVQTRVLEIETQPKDFLDNGGVQLAGVYMKLKPSGYDLNEGDYDLYDFSSYDNSTNANDNPIRSQSNVVELAVYYGLNGLDDLTSGGTYTGTDDIRYIIRIFSLGTPDTFEWSNDNGATFDDNGGVGFPITGAAQIIEDGLEGTFGATTGHTLTDEWIISAKAANYNNLGGDENSKAYAFFKSLDANGNLNVDDVILGGSVIAISYRETGDASVNVEVRFIASRQYANLEEWFYGDNILDDFFADASQIWFRRGTIGNAFAGAKYFEQDPTGDMVLIIRSFGTQNNDFDNIVRVYSTLEIISLDQTVLLETIPINDNSELFFEIGRTYDIDENGFHLGYDGTDVSQSAGVAGEMILDIFNCFSWGNGFESYKIKDLFNATNFKLDSRPSTTLENYRENVRIASLTYSQVYEQTTNFNGINEFNLSTLNFKDLDDLYESIQKLYARDTNLIVFQEDKIHRLPYLKNILFDTSGDVNVTQSTEVLGTEQAYAGEFGISTNPESFAFYGNAIYFTDVRRAVVCRLDLNGIIEISRNGMDNFFEDSFRELLNTKKLGAFDLFNKQYVLTVDETVDTTPANVTCGSMIYRTNQIEAYNYTFTLNNLGGEISIDYDITQGSVNITATFNASMYSTGTVSGSGTLSFTRDTLSEDVVSVVVTSVGVLPAEFTLENICPTGLAMDVVIIIINDAAKAGSTMTSRYKWGGSNFYSEIPVFEADGVTLFKTYSGVEGDTRFPLRGSTVEMQAYKDITNAEFFEADEGNSLSYLVSSTVYTEGQIPDIQAAATTLTITTYNEDGIPETNFGDFVFNRTSINERLYMIWDYTSLSINEDTYIYMYFDSSGSMDDTLAPLITMRDTLLKTALLPFYNDDSDLYDNRVFVISQANERTLDMLNANGQTPVGNIVAMVFQDEASPIYHPSATPFNPAQRTAQYNADILTFRTRLNGFLPDYYKGVSFQVVPNVDQGYKGFLEAVENGQSAYAGSNGLSDKTEILWKYDITDGGTPQYYLDQVTAALTELGFDLNP